MSYLHFDITCYIEFAGGRFRTSLIRNNARIGSRIFFLCFIQHQSQWIRCFFITELEVLLVDRQFSTIFVPANILNVNFTLACVEVQSLIRKSFQKCEILYHIIQSTLFYFSIYCTENKYNNCRYLFSHNQFNWKSIKL